MKKSIWMLIGLILHCLACAASAQDRQADPLIVSFAPFPPFAQYGDNGEREGFLIDLAHMIGDEIGLPIQIRDVANTQEFVRAQIDGSSTMIAGIAKLPTLEQSNVFSDPVATDLLRLTVLAGRASEFVEPPIDRRIGIVPPAVGSEEQALLSRNQIVEFERPEAAVMALLLGNVDGLLMPEPVVFGIAKRARADGRIRFVGTPLRQVERVVALHESRADLLPEVNAAIAKLQSDGRLAALRNKYVVSAPPPPPAVLTIGVNDYPPYTIQNADGTFSGLAVEAFEDLAQLAGLQVKFRAITSEEFQAGPTPQTYDIFPQLGVTTARAERMDFTLPLEHYELSIFTRSGETEDISDLDSLRGRPVGVTENSLATRTARGHGGLDLRVYDDLTELLDALEKEKIDAILYASEPMTTELENRDLTSKVDEVSPPFLIVERAPALRFGLGEIRERLNAVIPGYVISDDYQALHQKYLAEPVFWTDQRIQWALRIAVLGFALAVFLILAAQRRARTQLALAEQRARQAAEIAVVRDELQTVFNATNSGIVAFDRNGMIVRINRRARHMLGGIQSAPPFRWPKKIAFIDAETLQPLDHSADPLRRIMSGQNLRGETHLITRLQPGDDRRYVRVDNATVDNPDSAISVVMAIDDVSEEERNRQVVERKGRLDALGQLTGGIAHDFNNLLASQLYAIDLARKVDDAGKRDNYLRIASNAIQRGRSLTSRLLAFARKQPGLAVSRNASDLFAEFVELVRPMLEAHIEVAWSVEEKDLWIHCDQTQLETALMNLVLNARDAILRDGKGSRIEIHARSVRAHDKDLEGRQAVEGQEETSAKRDGYTYRYVEIRVADNGPGMDDETLHRCTDPFFTTKESNSGTGLGLAMVYGFLRQSNGDLRIYSDLGLGTTVQMTLPRGTAQGLRETQMAADPLPIGAGQTILLVEDEMQLLAVMESTLEDLGYRVITASSGKEALAQIEDGQQFDLLLTDVVMPGQIDGFELARRIRQTYPQLPVIYTSGYTGYTASEMGEVQAPLLQKPATPMELSRAIKAVMSKTMGKPADEQDR
ncbi:MAG: transporter substrate-binding domain-containing protein [Mangrovicoccus sp.]